MTELRLGADKRYEDESVRTDAMQDSNGPPRFGVVEIDRPVAVAAAGIVADLQDCGVPFHDLHDCVAAIPRVAQLPVP